VTALCPTTPAGRTGALKGDVGRAGGAALPIYRAMRDSLVARPSEPYRCLTLWAAMSGEPLVCVCTHPALWCVLSYVLVASGAGWPAVALSAHSPDRVADDNPSHLSRGYRVLVV